MLRDVSRVYGRADGGIAHLEPDLIGEHQVGIIADVELIEGCLRWIMDGPEAEQTRRRRDVITVLQRATQPEHGPRAVGKAMTLLGHLARVHIDTLVTDIIAVIVETPGALAHVLKSQIEHYNRNTLVAIDIAIADVLQTRRLSYQDLLLEIENESTSIDSEWDPETVEIQSAKTSMLSDISQALRSRRADLRFDKIVDFIASYGKPLTEVEGGTSLYENVEFYRRLAQEHPHTLQWDFLVSLYTLKQNLWNLGQDDEAMNVMEEAIGFCSKLAEADPRYLLYLETELRLAGIRLPARAAEAAHEALAQCAPVPERDPESQEAVNEFAQCYRELCVKAHITPDSILLERIDRAPTKAIRQEGRH